MRRPLRLASTIALAAVLLSSCAEPPAGTDGDLVDDWRPLAGAKLFTPRAGDCQASYELTGRPENYEPVDCAQPHVLETIHVGTFDGDLAERPTPSRFSSAAMRPAFAECDGAARAFVGADWRDGRLAIQVIPPSEQGWRSGARWFRCDLFVLSRYSGANGCADSIMKRVGSLRDVLKGPSPLALTCVELDDSQLLRPVECTKPHILEYVGIWTSPLERRSDVDRGRDAVHARCRDLVYRFAKMPPGDKVRTGTIYRLPSEQAWARGDRGVRCYFWTGGPTVSRSVRGRGASAVTVD